MRHRLLLAALLRTPVAQACTGVRKAGASSAIEEHPSYWGPFVTVGDGR